MKKIFNNISKIINISLLTVLLATLNAKANEQRHFTVGIEDGYYPYEYLNEKGEFTGFDVEVLNALCAKLNAECTLARGSFESLIPNLVFKKTDFVISALSITAEREQKINFSISYVPLQGAVYIVQDKSKFKSIKDLKTVGVQQGTTLASYLHKNNSNFSIQNYPSFDQEILDLKGNRIDAIFESYDVVKKYLKNPKEGIRIIGEKVYSPIISRGTGIAFHKENKELLEEVNKALTELKADGTINKLLTKYHIVE